MTGQLKDQNISSSYITINKTSNRQLYSSITFKSCHVCLTVRASAAVSVLACAAGKGWLPGHKEALKEGVGGSKQPNDRGEQKLEVGEGIVFLAIFTAFLVPLHVCAPLLGRDLSD